MVASVLVRLAGSAARGSNGLRDAGVRYAGGKGRIPWPPLGGLLVLG